MRFQPRTRSPLTWWWWLVPPSRDESPTPHLACSDDTGRVMGGQGLLTACEKDAQVPSCPWWACVGQVRGFPWWLVGVELLCVKSAPLLFPGPLTRETPLGGLHQHPRVFLGCWLIQYQVQTAQHVSFLGPKVPTGLPSSLRPSEPSACVISRVFSCA